MNVRPPKCRHYEFTIYETIAKQLFTRSSGGPYNHHGGSGSGPNSAAAARDSAAGGGARQTAFPRLRPQLAGRRLPRRACALLPRFRACCRGWRRWRLLRRRGGLCGNGSAGGAWRPGGGASCATTPRPAWRRRGRRGGGRGAPGCTRGWRRRRPGARCAAPARRRSRRRCWRRRAACCCCRRRRGAAWPRRTCSGCWACGRRGGCAAAACSSPRCSTRRPSTPRRRSTAPAAATWRPPGPTCPAACWTWASGAAGGCWAPACATATSTPRSSAPSRRTCAPSPSTTSTRPATSASSSRSSSPSSCARSTSARRRARRAALSGAPCLPTCPRLGASRRGPRAARALAPELVLLRLTKGTFGTRVASPYKMSRGGNRDSAWPPNTGTHLTTTNSGQKPQKHPLKNPRFPARKPSCLLCQFKGRTIDLGSLLRSREVNSFHTNMFSLVLAERNIF